MANTNKYTRVIVKKHTATADSKDFSGTYKLLLAAKSMPAPTDARNTVESTTMEDDAQTFEEGIRQNSQKAYTGNLEKKYLDAVEDELSKGQVDIMQLYGTDGVGGVAKYAYTGQVSAQPNEVSGTDQILEMTATGTPNTVPIKCTDQYTVVYKGNGEFTVTKKS